MDAGLLHCITRRYPTVISPSGPDGKQRDEKGIAAAFEADMEAKGLDPADVLKEYYNIIKSLAVRKSSSELRYF